MATNDIKPMKVCLQVIGYMGHAFPMIRLATSLNKRGHEVHFVTINCLAEKLKKLCEEAGITNFHQT